MSCVFCHLGTVPGLFCHRLDNKHSGWIILVPFLTSGWRIMNQFQCSHHISVSQSVVLRSSHRIKFFEHWGSISWHKLDAMTNSKPIPQRITAEVIALSFCTIALHRLKQWLKTSPKQGKGPAWQTSPKNQESLRSSPKPQPRRVVRGVRRKHRKAHDPCLPRA